MYKMDFTDNGNILSSNDLFDSMFNSTTSLNNMTSGQPFTLVPPTAVNGLTYLTYPTRVILSWTTPSLTGSSSFISSYSIYRINGSSQTLIGTTSSLTYTISGLSPYTSYTFGVAAVNGDNLSGTIVRVTVNTACFKEGTKILCLDEKSNQEIYIPIEKLRKGQKVKTALDGYLAIELIGKSTLYNSIKAKKSKDGLYKLTPDKYPELFEDLYMTGAHAVLTNTLSKEQIDDIKDLMGDIYITGDKYRLPVCLDDKSEPYNEMDKFEIWHLALQNKHYYNNYGIYANGLLVETSSIRYMKEVFDCELIE